MNSAETIKQALIRLGYTPIRAYREDGSFMGMRIFKDGEPVHETPIASSDLAIEIVESQGGFIQE